MLYIWPSGSVWVAETVNINILPPTLVRAQPLDMVANRIDLEQGDFLPQEVCVHKGTSKNETGPNVRVRGYPPATCVAT